MANVSGWLTATAHLAKSAKQVPFGKLRAGSRLLASLVARDDKMERVWLSANCQVLTASCKLLVACEPHEHWRFEFDLWKTRMKSGENAFHRSGLGIRYAGVEQFCCSHLQGGFTNGNRHDQDPARPSHGREE